MGKKIWLTIHPRKFGGEVSVPRPSVHSSVVMEGNQVSACRGRGDGGGGVCYKSCDVFVQPAFFSAGNRARNGVAKSSR